MICTSGIALIALFALCLSTPTFARLRVPPGEEDIRRLATQAPLIFRGQVSDLNLKRNEEEYKEGVAVIAVDRWYRSGQFPSPSRVSLHFAWDSGIFFQGHNCSNLTLGSNWIFFAKPGAGAIFELFHDCEGALAVSPLLAPEVSGNVLSQIEADFRAGLGDSDPEARKASIQRLAGLGLPISRGALHEVIANGTDAESKWALFAAHKTGDVSVLHLAIPVLVNLHHEEAKEQLQSDGTLVSTAVPYPQPEGDIALAIEKLREPEAMPGLIQILNDASDDLVRSCASKALMEIKDRRALDAFATHLSDPSRYVRYNSLVGISYVTHAQACATTKPEGAEEAEQQCLEWWKSQR